MIVDVFEQFALYAGFIRWRVPYFEGQECIDSFSICILNSEIPVFIVLIADVVQYCNVSQKLRKQVFTSPL